MHIPRWRAIGCKNRDRWNLEMLPYCSWRYRRPIATPRDPIVCYSTRPNRPNRLLFQNLSSRNRECQKQEGDVIMSTLCILSTEYIYSIIGMFFHLQLQIQILSRTPWILILLMFFLKWIMLHLMSLLLQMVIIYPPCSSTWKCTYWKSQRCLRRVYWRCKMVGCD